MYCQFCLPKKPLKSITFQSRPIEKPRHGICISLGLVGESCQRTCRMLAYPEPLPTTSAKTDCMVRNDTMLFRKGADESVPRGIV